MLKSGSDGSARRISWRTACVIDAGDPPATRTVSPVFRVGSYGYDTNAYGDGLPSRAVNNRKSLTTPTIVIHWLGLSFRRRNRCPTGSILFGQRRFAKTPLTIATPDRPCPSASVKSRPATSGTLSVLRR